MSVEFNELVGKTFDEIIINRDEESILFINHVNTQPSYELCHDQDCCESVWIESIDGDIQKYLPNEKILDAYESYKDADDDDKCTESCTWSFYVIRTMRDTFTIRFFGTSNGYYSETAALYPYSGLK